MNKFVNKLRRYRWFLKGRRQILRRINSTLASRQPLRIILGAGVMAEQRDGWISTDLPQFNILNEAHWNYFFSRSSIDKLLAEHVLEHLTTNEADTVLRLAGVFLKKGGAFRIAVPDGYHPDQRYIDYVKPGGYGPGSDDHKTLWNIESLSALAAKRGFAVIAKENYDSVGVLKHNLPDDDMENGLVLRTFNKSAPNALLGDVKYSSLIVDLIR